MTFKELREARAELAKEIVVYIINNPDASLQMVGRVYGVQGQLVSYYARKAGLQPRKAGRKAGRQ